jgi:hypothetical protein
MSVARNQTARAYSVLHDQWLQPSRLEIRDTSGVLAPEIDERARMKFDNTVRKASFRRVEPGQELPLFELVTQRRGEGWELGWGPFRVGPLPAGRYTAVVVWESRVNRYFDDASSRTRVLPDALIATVRSERTPLRLPSD